VSPDEPLSDLNAELRQGSKAIPADVDGEEA
jgi:hypothetical protein